MTTTINPCRPRLRWGYGLVALFPVTVLSATVRTEADSLRTDTLQEVTVSAPLRRIASETAPFQTSLDVSGYFNKQPRTLPESLQGMTGVWVQQTDHGGGSPIIRGLIGYQTVMLVDGVRLNNASFPSGPLPYLNTVDGLAAESVSVMPGAASVAYGSDAMGGVISMQSKSARFTNSSALSSSGLLMQEATTGGMEFATRGELNLANDEWAFHVGVDAQQTGNVHAGKGLGILPYTGYHQWASDVKLKRRLGDCQMLTAAYQGMRQSNIPTYLMMRSGKYDTYRMKSQNHDLAYLTYTYSPGGVVFHYWESTLSYSRMDGTQEVQLSGEPRLTSHNNDVRSVGWTADANLTLFSCWNIKAGIDLYHDKVFSHAWVTDRSDNTTETAASSYPDGSSMLSYGIFWENQVTWGKLRAGAGVRWSGTRIAIPNDEWGKVVTKPSSVVGDVRLSYELLPRFTVTALVASSFRAPNVNDMAMLGKADGWYFVPNYDLRPEKGLNTEVDFKYDGAHTRFSLNLYQNNLKGLVGTAAAQTADGKNEVDGDPVMMRKNISKAYVRGFEMAAEQDIFPWLAAEGNMCYTFGKDRTNQVPLSKIPPLFGTVRLRFTHRSLGGYIACDMADAQHRLSPTDKKDARIPQGGTPGWVTLGIGANYSVGHWLFSGKAGNLLNKAYRLHASGVDSYGVYGKATIAFRF